MGKKDHLVDEQAEPSDAQPQQECAAPETADLQAELAAQQDRVLRLQAEIQNLRSRQARELGDARQYASIDLLRDLLPVVDNIDRAIEAAKDSGDVTGLVDGVKLVRQQLITALAQHGCVEIPAEGEIFDPDRHHAILQQPSADVPAGQIMLVTQPGYQLHDRVVRPSHVIVSAGPIDTGNIAATESLDEGQV